MKQGYVYTVVFMLISSVVFTAILALTNAFYLPAIKANEIIAEKKSIMDSLGMKIDGTADEINADFDKYIRKTSISGMELYERIDDTGKTAGYALPFTGPGLWGTISGYAGISGDLGALLGINFLSQSETPGLGGRIDESWYREQYRGAGIMTEGKPAFDPEKNGIDGITGATVTSNSVTKIIKLLIEEKVAGLEAVK